MYSLEQLRGFVAVAEELSFRRAAERLNMTQPPLSRQVQKLEREIQIRLFDRGANGVSLTPAGKAFLNDARRLLRLAASAPEPARRIADGSTGVLRLGFTGVSAFSVLGSLISRLGESLPDVDIDLSELVTSAQLAALSSETIDLGIGRPPFDESVFASRVLQREALVVAMPADHRLSGNGRQITGPDLVGEDFIAYSQVDSKYFYDLTAATLSTNVRTVHIVSQVLTMVLLVAAHRGIAIVPASAKNLGIVGVHFAALHTAVPDPVELRAIWLHGASNPSLARAISVLNVE